MTGAPLIGVSTSEVRRPEDHKLVAQGEPPRSELALGERYLEAMRAAGALPVILAPVRTGAVDVLLDRLDGVCLSGGPDLHPGAYGAPEHPALGPTEPELDRFELALARRAVIRGMPVLGLCRGAQVLNVARGGTLHQHLPDLGPLLGHRQELAAGRTTHRVELEADSLLARLLDAADLEVNSFHHQAVAELGRGLRVVARSSDGVVEAIEGTTTGFVVGVQWHAECLIDRPEQRALFRALVEAASVHVAARGQRAA